MLSDYSLVYFFQVSMYLHGFQEDDSLFERDNFTDAGVTWSPKGTYLASFHEQGIQLWGGEKFEKIGKFKHYKVRIIKKVHKWNDA